MKKTLLTIAVSLFCGAFAIANTPDWQQKVGVSAMRQAQTHGIADVLVIMQAQADLSLSRTFDTKEARGTYVFNQLTQIAAQSQAKLTQDLAANHLQFRAFWAVNAVFVKSATTADLQRIAEMTTVKEIILDGSLQGLQPVGAPEPAATGTEARLLVNVTWGIMKIKADQVWSLGHTGQGVVVGGQDTGISWEETPIKSKYKGWNGTTADHNYNWHDAIHAQDPHNTGGPNPFGYDTQVPVDDNAHGTHTVGTMVGDVDDAGQSIGVAPNAKFIGCRNMERGWGQPSTYIECFQWFIAPTNLANANPDPTKAPHVINNSWGCPTSEGCDASNFNIMNTVVTNVKAAGIVVVVSAGNSGSSCSTVQDPAGMFEPSFSVGASNDADGIAGFSSRGPVTVDGSNRRKPNVAAPGVGVRSVTPGGGFANWNGTSMAGPHVAGAVALLISSRPALAGRVEIIEDIFEQTANHLTTNDGCGGDSPTASPNNTFGFGVIDVLAAIQAGQSVVLGTTDNNKETAVLSIMPNPAHDQVSLYINGAQGKSLLRIFNTAGQIIFSENQILTGNDIKRVDVSGFANGFYFYELQTENGVLKGKIVKN